MFVSIGRKLANKLKRPRSRGNSAKSTPSATPTHSAPPSPLKKVFRDDVFDFEEQETDPSCTKATDDSGTSSRSFTFSKDFDKNGVLYYLGKHGRTFWNNPADTLQVMVTFSDHGDGEIVGQASDAASRKPITCRTKSGKKSWICYDLGRSRRLVINHYTLRHGGPSKEMALQHWRLEGSENGNDWVTLFTHFNEQALQKKYGTGSWPIKGAPTAYRYFRIIQIGPNTSGSHELSIGGIELYGTLYETS